MRPFPALVPVVLTLVALGLGIFAWLLQRQLSIAEAALAEPLPSTLRAEQGVPERRATEPASNDASHIASTAVAANKAPAAKPTTLSPKNDSALVSSLQRQRMVYLRKAGIDASYAALFKKLGLAPAELEKLKILLAEKLSAWMDVFDSARAEGLDTRANAAQIQKLATELRTEAEDSIHTLLGDSRFQEYQRYEQTRMQRTLVNQIQLRLSYASTPLQGGQAEQLVALLVRHGTIEAPPAEAAYEGPRVTLTEAFIAQSQGFLSAGQIEAIRQFYQEKAELRQLTQQVARANTRP